MEHLEKGPIRAGLSNTAQDAQGPLVDTLAGH